MKRYTRDYDPEEAEEDTGIDVAEFASLEEYKQLLRQEKEKVEAKRDPICNTEAILSKLDEITLPKEWPWVEKLEVLSQGPVDVENPEDDLKREAIFYASALIATKQALQQLEQNNIPYKRPLDFYAETVKPDSHMAKVKQVLLNEQRKIAEVEERKKQQAMRKFAKEAHAEKKRERAREKRDALNAIDDLKHKPKYKHNEPSSQAFKKAIRKGSYKRVRLDEGSKTRGASHSQQRSRK